MSRLEIGSICGLIFGALSAAAMLPMRFPDKRAALLGAFVNRFSIGVVLGILCTGGWHAWLVGVIMGVLLSLSDAIVTKAYAPILLFGAIGGGVIGWVIQHFAH